MHMVVGTDAHSLSCPSAIGTKGRLYRNSAEGRDVPELYLAARCRPEHVDMIVGTDGNRVGRIAGIVVTRGRRGCSRCRDIPQGQIRVGVRPQNVNMVVRADGKSLSRLSGDG